MNEHVHKLLGRQWKNYRTEVMKLSREQASSRLGIDTDVLRRLEDGDATVSIGVWMVLWKHTGVLQSGLAASDPRADVVAARAGEIGAYGNG